MLDPALGALLAGLYALLFASAAVHKLRDRRRFAQVFAAYRVLPDSLSAGAVAMPLLEGLVAIGLVAGRTRAAAAGLGAGLLLAYALAVAINLRRGRFDLSCGCGGPNERRPIAAWMVTRNLLLAAALPALALPWLSRPLSAVDAVTVGGGIGVGVLIYASLDEFLARVAPRGARLRGAA